MKKNIAVIIAKTDEEKLNLCKTALKAVNLPDGCELSLYEVDATKLNAKYRNILEDEIEEKYKIYMTDSVVILDENFIIKIIDTFNKEYIAAIGILGAQTISMTGEFSNCDHKKGNISIISTNDFSHPHNINYFDENDDKIVDVRVIHPDFIATARKINWNEEFNEGDLDLYVLSRDLTQQNERLIVFNTGKPQILLNSPQSIREIGQTSRNKFQSTYAEIFKNGNVSFYSNNCELLYYVGRNVKFIGYHEIMGPEGISIGKDTTFQRDCELMLPTNNYAGVPRLIIGRACDIGKRCQIHAYNSVIVDEAVLMGANVYISDHNHAYKQAGVPIKLQGVDSGDNEVHIGYGAWIGNNVVIAGNITIGRGCVIGANTVLTGNVVIPDYCVVAGNPGKIIKMYDQKTREWKRINDYQDVKEIISDRESWKDKRPLLTIGIPTYNRMKYLKNTMECILMQVGNDHRVEILISDNDSTDGTEEYIKRIEKQYTNVRYHHNEENIGGDRNIFSIYFKSNGIYTLALGDDDTVVDGVLSSCLNILENYDDEALLHLLHANGNYITISGSNMINYIRQVSFYSTFISGLIVRTDYVRELQYPDKEMHTSLNQVYIVLSMLKQHQKFTILQGNIFRNDSGAHRPSGYDFGRVFLKNYLDIIIKYASLPPKDLSNEKKKLLDGMLLPWCGYIASGMVKLTNDRILEYYDEYYSMEGFYEDGRAKIKEICRL